MGKKLCVIKNSKLYIYEVKTSLKFYKIKEEILKKESEHINGIYNFNIEKRDYYLNNEEVEINGNYVLIDEKTFFEVGNYLKMFYRGIKYPEILNLALLFRDGKINSIEQFNKFRAPLYIHNMKNSKKKDKLLNNYPYDQYIDDILSCFTLKKTDCISYSNMEDLVKKIERVTRYNNNLDCGDSELFDIAKKAETSMFVVNDYGIENSGISQLKQMLEKHQQIYSMIKKVKI